MTTRMYTVECVCVCVGGSECKIRERGREREGGGGETHQIHDGSGPGGKQLDALLSHICELLCSLVIHHELFACDDLQVERVERREKGTRGKSREGWR